MKAETHPDYNFVTVTLADGTEFTTRSTMGGDTFRSEVDSSNHPFYTGKRTMVDTAGRVEKFRRRYGNAQAKQAVAAEAEEAEEQAQKASEAEAPVPAAQAAQAVSESAPAPETQTADGEQDDTPVEGTGAVPAGNPEQ